MFCQPTARLLGHLESGESERMAPLLKFPVHLMLCYTLQLMRARSAVHDLQHKRSAVNRVLHDQAHALTGLL